MLDSLVKQVGISEQQIEDARRTQQFFGGELISHCLSLGFVEEGSLMEMLAERYEVAAAEVLALRRIPTDAIGVVPHELLGKHRCCPFLLESNILHVAMLNPRDRLAIAEIERQTGMTVEPSVTIEYRLHQALKRYYGITSPYENQGISIAPSHVSDNACPTGSAPVDEPDFSAESNIGLDGRPLDEEEEPGGSYRENWRDAASAIERHQADLEIDTDTDIQPVDESMQMSTLEQSLLCATDRSGIAEALLTYSSVLGSRYAMFAVRERELRPILGLGDGWHGDDAILPLDATRSTVWTTALSSQGFYFGPVAPTSENRQAFAKLWGSRPDSALILPIHVKGRLVALLHIDDGPGALGNPPIPVLRRAVLKTGLAFERLLLQGKLLGC